MCSRLAKCFFFRIFFIVRVVCCVCFWVSSLGRAFVICLTYKYFDFIFCCRCLCSPPNQASPPSSFVCMTDVRNISISLIFLYLFSRIIIASVLYTTMMLIILTVLRGNSTRDIVFSESHCLCCRTRTRNWEEKKSFVFSKNIYSSLNTQLSWDPGTMKLTRLSTGKIWCDVMYVSSHRNRLKLIICWKSSGKRKGFEWIKV